MHYEKPHVIIIAETRQVLAVGNEDEPVPDNVGIAAYLDEVGATDAGYEPGGEHELESLIEVEGRMCYRSFAPGLNKNVTKVRADHKDYIGNILKSGHGSVLEHGVVSFIIRCSRIVTHELVRHRAGTAFSQESMRFVRLDDVGMHLPKCFENDTEVQELGVQLVRMFEQYNDIVSKRYKLDDPNTPFHVKKEVTSAIRRHAPSGHMTTIGFTANIRALRHIIEMRTAPGAEEEIRVIFDQVARICIQRYPAVFQDFSPEPVEGSSLPHWKPKNSKV